MRAGRQGRTFPRPRLERRLDLARTHRLTVLAAASGSGKSSLLDRWSQDVVSAWHTLDADDTDAPVLAGRITEALRLQVPGLPRRLGGEGAASGPTGRDDAPARAEALAAQLSRSLAEHLRRSVVLVLDDVHHVDGAAGPARFLEDVVRQAPPQLHVVLATQTQVPFPTDRLRDRGHVLQLEGPEFALTREETATWVTAELGEDAGRWAARLHEVTAGWPIAARMAIEALRAVTPAARSQRLASLATDEPFAALARRVLDQEPEPVRQLLRTVAALDWFTAELCEELGFEGAAAVIASLRRRGLFVEEVPSEPDAYALIALAREHLTREDPLPSDDRADVLARTAAYWRDRGRTDRVVRTQLAAGHWEDLHATLRERGDRLVTTGNAELVQRAVTALPAGLHDAAVDRLAGIAAQMAGNWRRAEECFERAAGDGAELDPGLAWRLGLIHHLRGELDRALAAYGRGVVGEPSRDTALLLAWMATVHWLRGEQERCAELASQALQHASAVDDPQALAAAHTVLAMLAALHGDRRANDAHYLRALDFAESAGDVLQIVRIRTNRSSHHLEEGGYDQALAELDIAIGLAESTGYGPFTAVALANRGEVRIRLGQLEEAVDELASAVGIWRSMGSAMVSYPLNLLGGLHLLRGNMALARERHTEALEVTADHGDLQGQVPALAGLARAWLEADPERARELAEEAVAKGDSLALVEALLAAGHAAAACGDRSAATHHALRAVELATDRRDRVGLAEALELQAELESRDRAVSLLDDAVALWEEVGDPVGHARVTLARAAHLPAAEARELARGVRDHMRTLGCRQLAARADVLIAELANTQPAAARVVVLGGFRVERDGTLLAANAWQSRKARDLFKILVARRGRPVLRDVLVEHLWPGDPPDKTANRLNVALSTIRSVLDPDKEHPSDAYVVTEQEAVRVDLERLEVDVEEFLAEAAEGTRLHHAGRTDAAVARLRRAEAMYRGEVFEEDPYVDWAVTLREEARATYLEVAWLLAGEARAASRPDDAVRYLLRIIQRDPYDERAHLELVATLDDAGRRGEARRRYLAYSRAMRELEVEPAPFPRG